MDCEFVSDLDGATRYSSWDPPSGRNELGDRGPLFGHEQRCNGGNARSDYASGRESFRNFHSGGGIYYGHFNFICLFNLCGISFVQHRLRWRLFEPDRFPQGRLEVDLGLLFASPPDQRGILETPWNLTMAKMKILMCTDGEEDAEAAIRFGGKLAKEMNADVSVLHVRRPVSSSERVQLTTARKKLTSWNLDIPGIDYLTRAREILEEVGLTEPLASKEKPSFAFQGGVQGATELHLIGAGGENVRLRLREGDPVEEILEEAEVGEYDLILLGSHGRRRLAGYFVGSTATRVADLATCSVLIAKNIREDHNFLISTDGSDLAERAEILGAEIARVMGAKVTILSVAEEESRREEAQRNTRRAEMILAQMGIEAERKVRVGHPSQEIIAEAKDHDIVVMGASGSSAVRKFFLGSVPLKVMEYGACPVLIVREKRKKIPLQAG